MDDKLESLYVTLIDEIERAEIQHFAVFDFDNTCIINDITESALAYMAVNDLIRDKDLVKGDFKNYSEAVFKKYYHLLDDGKTGEAYEFISKILSKFSIHEIHLLAEKVLKFEGEKISTAEIFGRRVNKGIKPRKETIELINFFKNNGVEVWIVSTSIDLLIKEAMEHFGIEASLIGVHNSTINGEITTRIESPMPMFDGKVECIKKFIHSAQKPLFGIGDSLNDLEMLEYCDIKAVISLQNALSEKAKQNGWFII